MRRRTERGTVNRPATARETAESADIAAVAAITEAAVGTTREVVTGTTTKRAEIVVALMDTALRPANTARTVAALTEEIATTTGIESAAAAVGPIAPLRSSNSNAFTRIRSTTTKLVSTSSNISSNRRAVTGCLQRCG